MKLNKGLNLDSLPVDAEHGEWAYAKNIVQSKNGENIHSEHGILSQYQFEFTVIGIVKTPVDIVVFSVGNDGLGVNFAKIELIRNGIQSTILRTNGLIGADRLGLVFNAASPIEGRYEYNSKNELIIVWWDGIRSTSHKPCMLNVDVLPFPVDGMREIEVASQSKINLIFLFPEFNMPLCDSIEVLDGGGYCKCGSYQFAFSYEIDSNNFTNYSPLTNNIYINLEPSSNWDYYDGDDGGTYTNKCIKYSLTNLDTRFKRIKVTVLCKFASIITAYEVGVFTFNSAGNYNGILQGTDNLTILGLGDILIPKMVYEQIKTGAVLEHRLLLANLISSADIRYQKYANNIKVNWCLEGELDRDELYNLGSDIPLSTKDPSILFDRKRLMHDEVLAIYIQFVLKNGTLSQWYHIPGRTPTFIDNKLAPKRYAWYTGTNFMETASINSILLDAGYTATCKLDDDAMLGGIDVLFYQTRDTSNNPLAIAGIIASNMGFWENQHEDYPDIATEDDWDIWEDSGDGDTGITTGNSLKGDKVRHHRMPSLKTTFRWNPDGSVRGSENYAPHWNPANKADRVGLTFSNIFIPLEIRDQVQSYRFGIAERTQDNCIIQGQSPFFFGTSSSGGVTTYPTPYNLPTSNTNTFCSHEFRHLLDKPGITSKYICNPLIIKDQSIINVVGVAYNTKYCDPSVGGSIVTSNYINHSDYIKKITTPSYIPNNINVPGIIINTNSEEKIFATLDNTIPFITTPTITGAPVDDTTFLTNICNWKQNCYVPFNNQKIYIFGSEEPILTTGVPGTYLSVDEYGGDTYLTYNSFRRTGSNGLTDSLWLYECFVESPINIGMRQEGTLDSERYYPKLADGTTTLALWIARSMTESNYYKYNNDYSALNDLIQYPCYRYDGDYNFTNKHPNRIAKSPVFSNEAFASPWRTFFANEYYEHVKDKGEIWKVEASTDKLFINHKYSLYIASAKEISTTSEIAAQLASISALSSVQPFLGTSDIFSVKPREIVADTVGYTGCQSQWATSICKYGYPFMDAVEGRVFIVNDEGAVNEISNIKVKQWLKNNLVPHNVSIDNPFTGVGLVMTYDPDENRLLIGKKDYEVITRTVWHFSYTDHAGTSYNITNIKNSIWYEGELGVDATFELNEFEIVLLHGLYYVVTDHVGTVADDININYNIGLGDFGIIVDGIRYIKDPLKGDMCLHLIELDYGESDLSTDYSYATECSFTLSYSFETRKWICFHEYYSMYMFYNRNGTYKITLGPSGAPGINRSWLDKLNNISNIALYTVDQTTPSNSFIDIIFNEPYNISKILNYISWMTTIITPLGLVVFNKTITAIAVYDHNQCTDLITIDPESGDWFNSDLGRAVHGTWYYNNLRDAVISKSIKLLNADMSIYTTNVNSVLRDWFDREYFTGKYFIVRLLTNNSKYGASLIQDMTFITDVDVNIDKTNL
jgi:hypothetical protein